jgi:polyphosphate kinase
VKRFLENLPQIENWIVESGVMLRKYFLDVSPEEQERRFLQRIDDPVRQWKLSPMDIESFQKWWDYTEAYAEMIRMTDTDAAPWWVINSNDKKRARLNAITHLLGSIPYKHVKFEKPQLGKRQKQPKHVSPELPFRNFVPDAPAVTNTVDTNGPAQGQKELAENEQ